MALNRNVALVFEASGISGWVLVKNLLTYPSASTFSRVIPLTNRPSTLEALGLPQDARIELHGGIDLRTSPEQVVGQLRARIAGLEEVTHVYYNGMDQRLSMAAWRLTYRATSAPEADGVFRPGHGHQGRQHCHDIQRDPCCRPTVPRPQVRGAADRDKRKPPTYSMPSSRLHLALELWRRHA